jgi:rhodanese-related sulfurtransferase
VGIQLHAILATIAIAAFGTRFLRRSALTERLREWAGSQSPWGAELFSCPHCLGFWISLPCAGLLAANWPNFAIMVLLGWRGGYYFNRLLDNLIVRSGANAANRQCHVCAKPYEKDFLQRLNSDFCSYRCWFDFLRDKRRSERPFFDAAGKFIRQEVYPMSYENVNPTQAKELLEGDGEAIYIDVRSMPEYENGHPAGALNIPVMHREAMGMVPNPDFVRVVQSHFAPDAKLLIGCQSGARSTRAAEALIAAGFTGVSNVTGGFGGTRTPMGETVERGWMELGFPVERGSEDDKSYPALVAGVGK